MHFGDAYSPLLTKHGSHLFGWQRVSILIHEYSVILPIEYSVTRKIFYQHCIFHALSCINRAAKEITLERNQAADFSVPVQFIQQFSVSFIHLQSSEKNCSMIKFHSFTGNEILGHFLIKQPPK